MMEKIKKIGSALFLFVAFCNTCFADVVWTDEDARNHGVMYPSNAEPKPINYILIGILVLVVVICAVIIIRRIILREQ